MKYQSLSTEKNMKIFNLPSDELAQRLHDIGAQKLQLTLLISTSLILNNCLS